MALVFCDGFDSYAATADLTKKWTAYNETPWVWHATNGRSGGGCIQAATTGGGRLRIPYQFAYTTNSGLPAMIAFWLKISATPASASPLIRFVSTNNLAFSTLRVLTSGVLQIYDADSAAAQAPLLGTTNVCDGNWHWVEVYFTNHSFGSILEKCYVDTTVQWNTIGYTGGGGNFDWFDLMSITGVTVSIDDVIAWNDTGSDLIGTSLPIGQKQINTLRPTSDSAVQFTRSTGSDSYALVDEVNPSSTDYVESGTSGHEDLYGYGNLGFTPASVTAVVLNTYVSNPGAGSISFRAQCKSSATTRDGTSTIASNLPRIYQEIIHKDPNGTIAWTGSAVDAATFGIKVV